MRCIYRDAFASTNANDYHMRFHPALHLRTNVMRQCVIILLMLIGITPSFAAISKKKSVTMEAMWQLIQDQQKEIEALKAKVNGTTEDHQGEKIGSASKVAATAKNSSDHLSSEGPASKDESSSKVSDKSPKSQGVLKSDAERKKDILASEFEKLKTKLIRIKGTLVSL